MVEDSVVTLRGRFAFRAVGNPSGPLVLCSHGFPDIPHTWDEVARDLAAAGYRAVAPFLRGYAPSVLEGPFDVDALADDLAAIADALAPDDASGGLPPRKVALLGHDWGAIATYSAIMRHPDRFSHAVSIAVPHPLAFVRNLLREPSQWRRSWYMGAFQLPGAEALLARGDYALVERLYRDWSPSFRVPRAHMERVKQCLRESGKGPLGLYRALMQPPAQALERVRRGRSLRIQTPTLFMMGQDDGCIGRRLARGQERFFDGPLEEIVIPGAGHFLPMERPDLVSRNTLRFLSR